MEKPLKTIQGNWRIKLMEAERDEGEGKLAAATPGSEKKKAPRPNKWLAKINKSINL